MFTTAPAIAFNANGTLTYTPRVNANGTANFNVTMEDSGSGVSPNDNSKLIGNFTITITAKNDAPTLITPPNTVREPRVNDSTAGNTVGATVVGFNAVQHN